MICETEGHKSGWEMKEGSLNYWIENNVCVNDKKSNTASIPVPYKKSVSSTMHFEAQNKSYILNFEDKESKNI